MKNILLLILSAATLSSCNFYKPAMINAPVLEEKGEVQLGISIGNGTDFTASYAITDHIAVSSRFTSNANLSYEATRFDSVITFDATNHNYELAIGYYNANNDNYILSVFGGYAMGKTGFLDTDLLFFDDDFAIGADFNSIFVQGSGFVKLDENNFIGLLAKFNSLNYRNYRYSSFFSDREIAFIPADENYFVGQVSIQYSHKGPKVGALAQLQYAFTNSNSQYFTVRQFGVHVGVYFRLNEIFRQKD